MGAAEARCVSIAQGEGRVSGLLIAPPRARAAYVFAHGAGGKWDATLAAGTAGGLAIVLVRYLVRAALSPLVDGAVAAATSVIRPLISVHAA